MSVCSTIGDRAREAPSRNETTRLGFFIVWLAPSAGKFLPELPSGDAGSWAPTLTSASVGAALSSGADLVIDRGTAAMTTPMVDAALNAAVAGGAELDRLVAHVRPGGRLVSITGTPPSDRGRRVRTSVMTVRRDPQQLAEIARLVDTAGVDPGVVERLPLTETPLVHRRFAAGALRGKIVLSPPMAA